MRRGRAAAAGQHCGREQAGPPSMRMCASLFLLLFCSLLVLVPAPPAASSHGHRLGMTLEVVRQHAHRCRGAREFAHRVARVLRQRRVGLEGLVGRVDRRSASVNVARKSTSVARAPASGLRPRGSSSASRFSARLQVGADLFEREPVDLHGDRAERFLQLEQAARDGRDLGQVVVAYAALVGWGLMPGLSGRNPARRRVGRSAGSPVRSCARSPRSDHAVDERAPR